MEKVLSTDTVTIDQNRRISETITREQARLRKFIRKHVPDHGDAEDTFQEVFYELVDAYRLMKPAESARSSTASNLIHGARHTPVFA